MSVTDPHIKSEKRGSLGLLTLVRPSALNALTHGMVKAIAASLSDWAADDAIRAVAIRGEGRAFCAGGDIRAVQLAVAAGSDEGAALLRDEYRMNAMIGAYPKPYVALIHGICMGGGAGVSVHGSHRLADSSLAFAMPETAIGFIPDIGSSYFLSRAPGGIGMYLGLTAERIGLGDALEAGLVTHAVEQAHFDAVIERLSTGEAVDDVIAPFVRKVAPGPLSPHRRQIQTNFSASSVKAILERLGRDSSDFARTTAQVIRSRSPTSLEIVFHQLRAAATLDLKQCLSMELRLALRLLPGHDFREGVRAALVDKDRAPKWQPSTLAVVGDVEAYFAPLASGDLF